VAFCLIEHLEKDKMFLKEMHRIIKKNGHIVIITSAFQFLWSRHDDLAHHKRRYTTAQVGEIMKKSGFSIKKLSYVNSFLFPAIFIIRIFQKYFNFRADQKNKFLLDVMDTPAPLKNIFYNVLKTESKMLNFVNFPFGVGILCVGQKT